MANLKKRLKECWDRRVHPNKSWHVSGLINTTRDLRGPIRGGWSICEFIPFPLLFLKKKNIYFSKEVGGGEEVEMLGGVINKLEGVCHVKLRA